MNALWSDIRQHPRASAVFFAGWLSLFAYTFATWGRGMSDLAYLMHWLSPMIASRIFGIVASVLGLFGGWLSWIVRAVGRSVPGRV